MHDGLIRLTWTKAVACSGLLIGVLLSWRLWAGPRTFPTFPIADAFTSVPDGLSLVLIVCAIISLLIALCSSRPRVPLLACIGLFSVLCLFDQTRWQPWVYQYLCLLGLLASFSWTKTDVRGRTDTVSMCCFLLAMVYVFGGIQKMNPGFVPMMRNLFSGTPYTALIWPAPFIELGMGLALLHPRTRHMGVIAALCMHALLLAFFGPWGQGANGIIVPWNIAMSLLVPILFWRNPDDIMGTMFAKGADWAKWTSLVLFGLLPALGVFGLWDPYLSFSLYAGNLSKPVIRVDDAAYRRLPASVARYMSADPGSHYLNAYGWAMAELNVPYYPAPRIYRSLARDICDQIGNEGSTLTVTDTLTPSGGGTERTFGCQDL